MPRAGQRQRAASWDSSFASGRHTAVARTTPTSPGARLAVVIRRASIDFGDKPVGDQDVNTRDSLIASELAGEMHWEARSETSRSGAAIRPGVVTRPSAG